MGFQLSMYTYIPMEIHTYMCIFTRTYFHAYRRSLGSQGVLVGEVTHDETREVGDEGGGGGEKQNLSTPQAHTQLRDANTDANDKGERERGRGGGRRRRRKGNM